MKKKQIKLQIFLISIGVILIFLTYFYYPNIDKYPKSAVNQTQQENLEDQPTDGQTSTFENVMYQGLYDLDKPFSVQSEKAYMLKRDPHIVYMTKMHVILNLKDGRIVNITSNRGRYDKITHDCFFQEDVRVTDKETKIFSDNLELVASKSFAKVYTNVRLNNPTGSLEADQIDYDFEKKYFKVSMFDEKLVNMKVVK
jgi:hypothetical protein|tara:strand:+ start:1666 stop:2259 length:594 start_codon:yes stop_codon:yes gene_type:complete